MLKNTNSECHILKASSSCLIILVVRHASSSLTERNSPMHTLFIKAKSYCFVEKALHGVLSINCYSWKIKSRAMTGEMTMVLGLLPCENLKNKILHSAYLKSFLQLKDIQRSDLRQEKCTINRFPSDYWLTQCTNA